MQYWCGECDWIGDSDEATEHITKTDHLVWKAEQE